MSDNFTDFSSNEENTYSAVEITSNLNKYYTPLLVIIGCIGNLISILVFIRSELREQTTSLYLSVLAITDTIFLCQLLLPWMYQVDITELFAKQGFCQFFVYMAYVTCNLNAWLIVAFTFERFVAVIYPLRCNVICTMKHARYIVIILVTVALLLYLPVLVFATAESNDCTINIKYMEEATRFNIVDMVWSFTAPLSLITILNACIVVGLYRSERYRRRLMAGFQERQACFSINIQRTTKMLLVVSTVFIVLNLPSYILRIFVYRGVANQDNGEIWITLQNLGIMCNNTNFGINFFLYCLSGEKFRAALFQIMPWLKCGKGLIRDDHPLNRNVTNPNNVISL